MLHIALLPVVADTVGYLHEDAVRLLYRAATVKASGNVDNEGLIGVRGRIIVSASDGRTSSGNTRPTWDSSSLPPARSNGTTPSTLIHFSFAIPRSQRS